MSNNSSNENNRQEFCPNCGEPVDYSDRYCPKCGKKLKHTRIKQKTDTTKEISQAFVKFKNSKAFPFVIAFAVFVLVVAGIITAIQKGYFPNNKTPEYITQSELDPLINTEFQKFIDEYDDKHNDSLCGFLPEVLKIEQNGQHQYDYYYVYLVEHSVTSTTNQAAFKVIRFSATLEPDKKYTTRIVEKYNYPVYLTCVNDTPMNVRSKPNMSGEIVGGIDTNQTFQVKLLDCSQLHSPDNGYSWYSIDGTNDTQWVADGIMAQKEYYKFENGNSTKSLICHLYTRKP